MNGKTQNDRRHERVTVNREFVSIDAFVAEYVTNISASGVFIRSRQPLPIGTLVNLRFTVLDQDIETIEGIGQVVHVRPGGEDPGMGVVFRELTPRSQQVISRLTAGAPGA